MTSTPITWHQLRLVDPCLVTVRLTIGLDGRTGTLGWGLALHHGTEDELVAMEVSHDPLCRASIDTRTRLLASELRRTMANLSPF